MFARILSVIYLTVLAVLTYYRHIPTVIFSLLLTINISCFLFYALDKYKAKRGYWRIKETRLHLLSLIGGWPAAAFAQHLLRHKNAKKPFQIQYWLTVITNTVALTSLLYFFYGSNKQWFY